MLPVPTTVGVVVVAGSVRIDEVVIGVGVVETGHTVVERMMVSVVTLAGQSVTVGAHEVTV